MPFKKKLSNLSHKTWRWYKIIFWGKNAIFQLFLKKLKKSENLNAHFSHQKLVLRKTLRRLKLFSWFWSFIQAPWRQKLMTIEQYKSKKVKNDHFSRVFHFQALLARFGRCRHSYVFYESKTSKKGLYWARRIFLISRPLSGNKCPKSSACAYIWTSRHIKKICGF